MRFKQFRQKIYFLLLFLSFLTSENLLASSDLQDILKESAKSPSPNPSSADVNPLKDTQTILISSPEKSAFYSQPVIFAVNVVPTRLPGITPTGSVQFLVDQVVIATQPLVNGKTKLTILTLATTGLTQHYIVAVYSGDEIYASSRDNLHLSVFPLNTATSLKLWPNPSLFGQPVKLTVNVDSMAPGTATPTGSVQFQIDGMNVATANLDPSGQATFSSSEMSVGAHMITAIYQKNENFNESRVHLNQRVDQAHSKMQLISSENSSLYGQPVTFTAKLSFEVGIPTGLVQFTVDEISYDHPVVLNESGEATITIKDLASGIYKIGAYYLGEERFTPSTVFLTQRINPAQTSITLTSSENPSKYGRQPVTLTAKVSSENRLPPMGFVQFKINGKIYDQPQPLPRSGEVTFLLQQLKAGVYQIEADYLGDENFNPSNTSLTQQVEKAKTTGITSSENPSTYGKPVRITATVTAEDLIPTGLVQFKIDGENFGQPQLLSTKGQAIINIQQLKAGSHQIEVDYLGSENFSSSSASLTQRINKAQTSISLISSVNPSVLGEAVTFTATVSAGEGLSGTVQFQIDEKNIGNPFTLNENNQAALTVSSELKQGEQKVVAIYSGDENFEPSTSLPLLQTTTLAVFPPTEVEGFQIVNRVGTEFKLINILKWKAPKGEISPVAYRIYRDSALKSLIATIPANYQLEFIDPVRTALSSYPYFIVSVDEFGHESEPASITIKPIPKEEIVR